MAEIIKQIKKDLFMINQGNLLIIKKEPDITNT